MIELIQMFTKSLIRLTRTICPRLRIEFGNCEIPSSRVINSRLTTCNYVHNEYLIKNLSHGSRRRIHTTPKRQMFIQVEETPNPNSLKFYPGETVLESGTADFQDKVQASLKSPLAKALFRIRGVKSVFFAQDFITISKDDDEKVEWSILKPQIFSEIMVFYTMKQPILYTGSSPSDPNRILEDDSEIVRQIKELISDKIRPTIQEDGGDLEYVSYEDRVVRVRLQGACTSCPSSTITLKNGIRNMLQFYLPEIEDVEQVVDE